MRNENKKHLNEMLTKIKNKNLTREGLMKVVEDFATDIYDLLELNEEGKNLLNEAAERICELREENMALRFLLKNALSMISEEEDIKGE